LILALLLTLQGPGLSLSGEAAQRWCSKSSTEGAGRPAVGFGYLLLLGIFKAEGLVVNKTA
jgi:hypothetical protein